MIHNYILDMTQFTQLDGDYISYIFLTVLNHVQKQFFVVWRLDIIHDSWVIMKCKKKKHERWGI